MQELDPEMSASCAPCNTLHDMMGNYIMLHDEVRVAKS